MSIVHYRLVQHDGGWAYTLNGTFSETFATHDAALKRARRVAAEQQVPGESSYIEFQTADGQWHIEHVRGNDRPQADVSG